MTLLGRRHTVDVREAQPASAGSFAVLLALATAVGFVAGVIAMLTSAL